ncbi:RICIN domain-containing protein [Pedobacter frigidisoli]|uniref:RICIN domain-containing protein n=1 Tax=Pedobacter frigidisoli TaxID=2530455 RepID=UPI00198263D3|nr:RICIN domain-containing protein [Pedobacter frigidisoli]
MKIKLLIIALVFSIFQTASAQKFKGNFAIKNVQNGMLLRIKDASNKNGTPLVAYDPQNWKCMTWNFISADSNTYQLKNLFTGKTFQPKQGEEIKLLEEQPIILGNDKQQYTFEAAGKDIYFIKLKGTSL